jgi:8-oxo-dGTP pyrophosphatase MutT (NUDIX family)
MSQTTSIAQPRLSATMLLIRDGAGAPEVLMVKRHYQIDFAAGAFVFPGGKACPGDADPHWQDFTDGGFDSEELIARVAAMREVYEETGLLLARPESDRGAGQPLAPTHLTAPLAAQREAVDRGETQFLELMRLHRLVLALDQLVHFGHWITPVIMPKRFDTQFYLAAAPPGQMASHDGRETTDTVWIEAERALELERAGEATIIFPTRMNLIKLARASSVADAYERFSREPVVSVLPEPSRTEAGEPCLIIPEAAGYGQTVELLSNIKV